MEWGVVLNAGNDRKLDGSVHAMWKVSRKNEAVLLHGKANGTMFVGFKSSNHDINVVSPVLYGLM